MSRELDFIDFINEQADVEKNTKLYQDRNPDAWSIRSSLSKLSAEDIENPLERDILLKYQDALRQLNKKNQELYDTREHLRNIHAGDDKNYLADTKKELQESASTIASQIDTLDRQLIELQEDPLLKPVIDREKDKWHQREEQRSKEALARYHEKVAETQRELMERYQKSRQEALMKREHAQQQQKQKIIKESKTPPPGPEPIVTPPKEEPKVEAPKENKLMNLIASKRIAAVISIVLCTVLFVSFLSAFTTKRDTYICYTTKTGECFHSATCQYLNTAYETTVYEASQKYKVCKYCNPCVEQYETTITERNYVIPAIISIPTSVAVFFLLTYKKRENTTKEFKRRR